LQQLLESTLNQCVSKQALLEMENEPSAPVLDYNLPQSTRFSINMVIPVEIPTGDFQSNQTTPPQTNAYDRAASQSTAQLRENIVNTLTGRPADDSVLFINGNRDQLASVYAQQDVQRLVSAANRQGGITEQDKNGVPGTILNAVQSSLVSAQFRSIQQSSMGSNVFTAQQAANRTTGMDRSETSMSFDSTARFEGFDPSTAMSYQTGAADDLLNNKTTTEIANQMKAGYLPVLARNWYGEAILRFVKKPPVPKPQLVIRLRIEVSTYLGDYGAGKTVNTFSLLPGEKTNITIRSYRNEVTTRTRSQNILDSFTQESAADIERLFEEEQAQNNARSNSVFDSESRETESTRTSAYTASANVNANFLGKVKIGVNASGSSSGSSAFVDRQSFNNSRTLNEEVRNNVRAMNKAVQRHVDKSASSRQVEVNSTTSTTVTTTNETVTVREIENVNLSRVLNFAVRQMNQEHVAITYISDVSFVYTNGYPENTMVTGVPDLGRILEKMITDPAKRRQIRKDIFDQLSNIFDYEGNRQSLIERRIEEINNYVTMPTEVAPPLGDGATAVLRGHDVYMRMRKIESNFTIRPNFVVKVPGIILDVNRYVLPTDSVIVDALLGRGEALDCYNREAQMATVAQQKIETYKQFIEAQKHKAMLDAINALPTAAEKVAAYKEFFGKCCDTPTP
jgi:hypothetical protein